MITAFYTATTGTIWSQKGIDVVANNLANTNTIGYKAHRVSFSDLLYTNMTKPDGEDYSEENLKAGHGAKIQSTDTIFKVGSLQPATNMDYAIDNDDGFFAIMAPDGNTYFTRNGSFGKSVEPDGVYLVNGNGDYVLNSQMEKILIPSDVSDNQLSDDHLDIGVFKFDNKYMLENKGYSRYEANEKTGEPVFAGKEGLVQGYLENSSVDTAEEMTKVIMTQRSFQFNARMVSVADEMMGIANQLW